MQDENQVQPNEVEEQETVEVSPVEELVNQITDGELNKAETSFQSIVQDKIVDALDAERVSVAGAIYNDNEEVEISDEEVEEEMPDHDEVEYEEDKEEEKSEEDAS